MTKINSRTRILALFLAVLTLFSILPMTASVSTIADGSKTCTIAPVERHYFLTTTAGTRLGASAYQVHHQRRTDRPGVLYRSCAPVRAASFAVRGL